MTLKTSFFNKEIYSSTVKRFLWGSLLYFFVLFNSTCLSILSFDSELFYDYSPRLFSLEISIVPLLLTLVVPTVVALLVFGYIHSKKYSIFLHSLPVSRKSVYISTLCAAFTLMITPIIANGIILIIISFSSNIPYSTSDCFLWMARNALSIFLMFSVAVFSANITGSKLGSVIVNILLHSFISIIVTSFYSMAEHFLYGLPDITSLYDIVGSYNFTSIASVLGVSNELHQYTAKIIICSIIAFAFYILSYLIYKKRKIETAGTVAGFRILNPAIKYAVTLITSMIAFTMGTLFDESWTVLAVTIVIDSLIAYFGCEMILKKTTKVLHSWKGYIAFAAVFGAFVIFISQTSFFGYETRIPEKGNVAAASIADTYDETTIYYQEEEVIEKVLSIHSGIVKENDIPAINSDDYADCWGFFTVKYNLKSGGTLERLYGVSEDEYYRIMNELYTVQKYKEANEVAYLDNSEITNLCVNDTPLPENQCSELLSALRQDLEKLSYDDIYNYDPTSTLTISIDYIFSQPEYNQDMRYGVDYYSITGKYENTIAWIMANGYGNVAN